MATRALALEDVNVEHGEEVVRPERFELPAFWFVARRSIQLSYGRIPILTAFQQLTAEGAFSSTASFEAFGKKEKSCPP